MRSFGRTHAFIWVTNRFHGIHILFKVTSSKVSFCT